MVYFVRDPTKFVTRDNISAVVLFGLMRTGQGDSLHSLLKLMHGLYVPAVVANTSWPEAVKSDFTGGAGGRVHDCCISSERMPWLWTRACLTAWPLMRTCTCTHTWVDVRGRWRPSSRTSQVGRAPPPNACACAWRSAAHPVLPLPPLSPPPPPPLTNPCNPPSDLPSPPPRPAPPLHGQPD